MVMAPQRSATRGSRSQIRHHRGPESKDHRWSRNRPYTLRAAGFEEHIDTLLDTPDRRITGQMHALRIRATNSTLTLTLKGPNTGENEVHVRQEWEAPLTPPLSMDPESWPEPIASKVAGLLVSDEPLAPLLHVTVERRLWTVRRGNRVIVRAGSRYRGHSRKGKTREHSRTGTGAQRVGSPQGPRRATRAPHSPAATGARNALKARTRAGAAAPHPLDARWLHPARYADATLCAAEVTRNA